MLPNLISVSGFAFSFMHHVPVLKGTKDLVGTGGETN